MAATIILAIIGTLAIAGIGGVALWAIIGFFNNALPME